MFRRHRLILTILSCASFIVAPAIAGRPSSNETLVAVDSGIIRGAASDSVISWKGIPYAAAPVGALRWRNPQPVKKWTTTRDTIDFGPACVQPGVAAGSEDCLTLNVWRPTSAGLRLLPVMVWLNGGASGSTTAQAYTLDAMARQGVVTVSVNYRLGRLGYFAHPALATESPGEVRGNYGYMDQLAALQWVKRNIAAFGGDANRVTLFGESAGGGSVLAHLVSPMSQSLFARVILQSPGSPGPRAQVLPPLDLPVAEKVAIDWARSMGTSGPGYDVLERLRSLPVEKVMSDGVMSADGSAVASNALPQATTAAIVDGRFLVERPDAALAAGRQAKVPVIVGATDRDRAADAPRDSYDLFSYFGVDAVVARRVYDPRGDQALDDLKQQVLADRTFVEPARFLANELALAGQPVWLYRFAYVAESLRAEARGAVRGLEVPFVMNIPAALVKDRVTPGDRMMSGLASAYWVAFGLTGDPNGSGRPAWPQHDPAVDRLIHFTNGGVIVGTDPTKPRLDLWERVWSRQR